MGGSVILLPLIIIEMALFSSLNHFLFILLCCVLSRRRIRHRRNGKSIPKLLILLSITCLHTCDESSTKLFDGRLSCSHVSKGNWDTVIISRFILLPYD